MQVAGQREPLDYPFLKPQVLVPLTEGETPDGMVAFEDDEDAAFWMKWAGGENPWVKKVYFFPLGCTQFSNSLVSAHGVCLSFLLSNVFP